MDLMAVALDEVTATVSDGLVEVLAWGILRPL
jgi:hypothetical protein